MSSKNRRTQENAGQLTPYDVIRNGARKVRSHRRNKDALHRLERTYGSDNASATARLHAKIDEATGVEAKQFVDTLYETISQIQPLEVCRALGV